MKKHKWFYMLVALLILVGIIAPAEVQAEPITEWEVCTYDASGNLIQKQMINPYLRMSWSSVTIGSGGYATFKPSGSRGISALAGTKFTIKYSFDKASSVKVSMETPYGRGCKKTICEILLPPLCPYIFWQRNSPSRFK